VADELNLSNLSPAEPSRGRKRIGRVLGSGKGRYSGRGLKGQKARSGSHKMRAGFEGGQMPAYMRLPKQRGNTSKDAMPVGPFRTQTVPVNLRDLEERFDDGAEVTPEALVSAGVLKNTRVDVKILGEGELSKKLTIRVHAISASARGKVEQAGGAVELLRVPGPKKRSRKASSPTETGGEAESSGAEEAEVSGGEAAEASDGREEET
jgi:large subunit ribosomal protein L15